MGCSSADSSTAAKALLSADLRGIDSHGVARLTGYVRLWEAKRANATPDIRIIHETASTAVVDGDSGLGLVVAPFAMEVAIEKAKKVGTGWVSVQNSNHFGIAGYHAMKAVGTGYDRYRHDKCKCTGCTHIFHREAVGNQSYLRGCSCRRRAAICCRLCYYHCG